MNLQGVYDQVVMALDLDDAPSQEEITQYTIFQFKSTVLRANQYIDAGPPRGARHLPVLLSRVPLTVDTDLNLTLQINEQTTISGTSIAFTRMEANKILSITDRYNQEPIYGRLNKRDPIYTVAGDVLRTNIRPGDYHLNYIRKVNTQLAQSEINKVSTISQLANITNIQMPILDTNTELYITSVEYYTRRLKQYPELTNFKTDLDELYQRNVNSLRSKVTYPNLL